MRFPAHRVQSLPFDSRMKAIDAWQRFQEFRRDAVMSRKRGWVHDASISKRIAVNALRNVKFWAEKAKEIRNV